MNLFGPKLEPGERMVASFPSLRFWHFLRLAALFLCGFSLYSFYSRATGNDWFGAAIQLLMAGIMASLAFGWPGGGRRWMVVVTNRRLLLSLADRERDYEALPLRELQIVNPGGIGHGQILVRHGAREISIPTANVKTDERVLAAIQAARGDG